jgi:hypothetical protein
MSAPNAGPRPPRWSTVKGVLQRRAFWRYVIGILGGLTTFLGLVLVVIQLRHETRTNAAHERATRSEPAPAPARASDLAPGVRIIERRTTLDLSGWKATTEDDIASEIGRSLVVSHNEFVLERLHPRQREFVHSVGWE